MFKKSLTTLALSLVLSVYAQSSMAAPVKNIILVHVLLWMVQVGIQWPAS